MNIVFLDTQTVGNVDNLHIFEEIGNFKQYPITLPNERVEKLKDADVVITNKVIIDKETIDLCPSLKLICVAATGINNIDIEYAQSKGIVVKNVVNYSTESVAQLTVGMILNFFNQLFYYDNYVKSGNYIKSDMFTHFGPSIIELKGKRIGIIGLGNIGKRVANIMEVFYSEIVYFSTSGNNISDKYKRVDLDELLKTSDIISIHAPLNDKTKNLIGLNEIKKMKPTAFIINAGRGGIINEAELAEALNNNIIAGAATDVYENEPIKNDSPFYNIKKPEKLILTPHIAWASKEARTLLIEKIADNIREFINK